MLTIDEIFVICCRIDSHSVSSYCTGYSW